MTIQKLAPPDTGLGAELLAQAFRDDPMMEYFVIDKTKMLEKPLPMYRGSIRYGLRYGEVHALQSMDGIAVWVAPGNGDFSLAQMIRSGMLQAVVGMGPRTMARFFKSYSAVEEMKKRSIDEPHWLLLFLGIAPSKQGQGLGSELIKPILERADTEGVPCYLESANERNLSFYRRHGFEVAAQTEIPGGPRMWAMRRS